MESWLHATAADDSGYLGGGGCGGLSHLPSRRLLMLFVGWNS